MKSKKEMKTKKKSKKMTSKKYTTLHIKLLH